MPDAQPILTRPDHISEEDYLQTQSTLLLMADLVVDLPLAGFIAAANHADAVGPILDPTLWMRGNKRLEAIRKLAEGLHAFQRAAIEFRQVGQP